MNREGQGEGREGRMGGKERGGWEGESGGWEEEGKTGKEQRGGEGKKVEREKRRDMICKAYDMRTCGVTI